MPALPAERSRAAAGTGLPESRRRAVGDQEKEAKRLQILLAAKKVFADAGFHGCTMANVATAANVSYGAVYWYFPSKDEIFHALVELEEEALRSRITAALAELVAEDDPEESLGAAIRAILEFFEEDRAAVKLLFRDSYALGGRFESHLMGIYERFIDDLASVLAAAQRRRRVIAVPPRVAAFSVAALVGQLAYRRLTTDDGLDAGVLADFVVRLIMDGLRPR